MLFRRHNRAILMGLVAGLAACAPKPTKCAIIDPPQAPKPTKCTIIDPPQAPKPTKCAIIDPPQTPTLSPLGENLIIEFEVGGKSGYNPHPEAPDCRFSGVTIGIGYDLSTNAPDAIRGDWGPALGLPVANRLAATHPYTGCTAKAHLHEVRDILVNWASALGVFDKIDVAREFYRARRALPGFDALRPNAQAALISLGFNRGWSMAGDSRREMRGIRDAVLLGDYDGIEANLRRMVRVWKGTDIERGMTRRRFAEADLVKKP